MRTYMKLFLALIAAIAFVVPAWASHTLSAPLYVSSRATIGSTTLKQGNYRITVDPKTEEIRIMSNDRVVATVPGKWVTLKTKSPYTAVVMMKNQIQEIDFSGKTQAIRVE